MKKLLLLGAAALLSLHTNAQEFDPNFDNDGWRADTMGNGLGQSFTDIAMQPDNKVVACGLYDLNLFDQDASVARYNIDGSLDNSFGTNGKVYISTGASGAKNPAVAIAPSGAIYLAATRGSGGMFYVIRLNTNGTPDNTFGTNGILADSILSGTQVGGEVANEILVQPDGKILVAGSYNQTAPGNEAAAFIIRYNSDGTRDNSFGTAGMAKVVNGGNAFFKLLLYPDGRILAGGATGLVPLQDWFIARFNADGTSDNSFGPVNGTQTIGMQYKEFVKDMGMQSDGSIIIGGPCGNGNVTFRIVKLTANGFNDANFGTDVTSSTNWGYTKVELQTFTDHQVAGLAVLPDDKIMLGGTVDNFKFAALRFKADGDPDNTFGTNSLVDSQFVASNNMFMGAAAFNAATGRFYIVGRTYNGNDAINSSAVVAVKVAAPNSVKEVAGTRKLSIYPNPVSGILHMESIEGNMQVQDISGRTIISARGKDIDVSLLSSGMYFIRCTTQDGTAYTGQFVKN